MYSKKIATFDIDKTLSKEFLITPIIQSEEKSELVVSGTYEKSMEILGDVKSGWLEYEDAAHRLLVVHAQGLKGQRVSILEAHTREYLGRHTELFRGFGVPVMKMLGATHELIAVTAEPEYMARSVVQTLGMDKALASQYEVASGLFTGRVAISLAHRSEKRRLIGGLRPDVAFGDSAGDIEMLEHSHNAYCISPDAVLSAKAKECDWKVFNGDTDTEMILASIQECLES
jgi:phosphoserine phosphatase